MRVMKNAILCSTSFRLFILVLSVILILSGTTALAITLFAPKTHLELVVFKIYTDGTNSTVIYKPGFLSSPSETVKESELWTSTLQLYIAWVIEPEDWTPEVSIKTVAEKSFSINGTTVKSEVLDPYISADIAKNGGNSTAYYPITITREQILSMVNGTGVYQLIYTFRTTYTARDPFGVLHNETLTLTYTMNINVARKSTDGGQNNQDQQDQQSNGGGSNGGGGGATFTVSGDVSFQGTTQLLIQQVPTYRFSTSRQNLFTYGLIFLFSGAVLLVIGIVFMPFGRCKVG